MNRLLAEGEFLLSGEFHYFQVPRDAWRDRLRTMADAGLRAASIGVPWNWHAPAPDLPPDFTGCNVPERDLPAVLATITDPSVIVLGGGLMRSAEPVLDRVRQLVRRIAPFPPAVTLARFRASAALAGAGAAALGHGAPGTGLGLGTPSGASR